MKYSLPLLIIFQFNFLFGQQHDSNWLVGGTCNINSESDFISNLDFRDQNLSAESLHGFPFRLSLTNASISDKEGRLLFYTNGQKINNWKHEGLKNGDRLIEDDDCDQQNLPQGAVIVPYPGKDSLYVMVGIHEDFIFEEESVSVFAEVYFNVINMSAENGEGELVIRKELIIADTLNFGQGTVCQHANGRDWWLILFEYDSNRYYRYLIDLNGITDFGILSVDSSVPSGLSQVVFSPDGTKYATINTVTIEEGAYLNVFDFDRCNGVLVSREKLKYDTFGTAAGVAFSGNSRFLYVNNPSTIYQYDLWEQNFQSSGVIVGEYDGFQENGSWPTSFQMSQLAPNNKIYINTPSDGHFLHVIHEPNKKGLACNFEQRGLEWPTWKNISIPNFPHYRMGPLEGSLCDTIGINNIVTDTCNWLKGNAKWTYSAWSPSTIHDIIGIEVIGDTLIEDRLCSILGADNSGVFIEGSELIVFYDKANEKVHFNENDEFKLLYNFSPSLQPGDTVEYFFPNNWEQYNISETSEFIPEEGSDKYVFVDQEWVDLLNGEQLRIVQAAPVVENFEDGCINMVRIIDGVGSSNGFLGRPCIGLPLGFGEFFRCFESNILNYKEIEGECITTDTSVDGFSESAIQVFPNPTNDIVNIQSDQSDIRRVKLFSSLGQKVFDKKVEGSEMDFSVRDFAAGVYWLDVELHDGSSYREKVLILGGE